MGEGSCGGQAEEWGLGASLGFTCMSMRGRHTAQELIACCHPTACCQEQGRLACNIMTYSMSVEPTIVNQLTHLATAHRG
eukprot:1162136-Pelagomonas_calceolata.AAC.22